MKSLDDIQKLVLSAQNGEAVAWNALFRKHYPWMYATALQICGNIPAAKDAVQETLVNAYLKLQQLKDLNAFAGWLKTSLVRYCRRNKQEHSVSYEQYQLKKTQQPWEDELNRKLDWYAQQARLYNTLARLPDILQSVLLLRYYSNFNSYEQIASILCIPVGTVRSRLNQVKQKMMEHWQDSSDDNDKDFRQVKEWNDLYTVYFDNVYTSLHYREKLIAHFDRNLHLVFTSGKVVCGRRMVEQQIEEDILYGNSFAGLQVMSSGNISVVEVNNVNPAEYPDRCPDSTIFVLQRTGNKATRLHLHNFR